MNGDVVIVSGDKIPQICTHCGRIVDKSLK